MSHSGPPGRNTVRRYDPTMSQDHRRHPFDADRFLDGFTVEERQVPVDPDSPLGREMAEYRERQARGEVEELDPDTWTVEPIPVEPDE